MIKEKINYVLNKIFETEWTKEKTKITLTKTKAYIRVWEYSSEEIIVLDINKIKQMNLDSMILYFKNYLWY